MNEFKQAQRYIAGGVNSPVRAFAAVGGEPVFIAGAEGPYLIGEDGKRYIDYVGSWGPMIAGHAHPDVVRAVQKTAARGLSFGAPSVLETELARKVSELVPSIERVRFVNSGTEATMTAIRLARGVTGRDKIVKFEGCYHGHADALLVKAGSGALTLGQPSSPGVPSAVVEHTLVARYNDLESVRRNFEQHGERIACIIVEPVAGNMNCVPPVTGFLEGLRAVCDEYGCLLVFDEVMSGFRVAQGGAQERYGVTPDLTTLGKVVGGGMPVGALGGAKSVMNQLAPNGPVYQAGTLSGNPVAMAAGIATLDLVCEAGFYPRLEAIAGKLCNGLKAAAANAGIAVSVNQGGAMFGLFFTADEPVRYYEQVMACDVERFRHFFHAMLERGVYFAPSAFEAGFVSAAHTDEVIDETIAIAKDVFSGLNGQGTDS